MSEFHQCYTNGEKLSRVWIRTIWLFKKLRIIMEHIMATLYTKLCWLFSLIPYIWNWRIRWLKHFKQWWSEKDLFWFEIRTLFVHFKFPQFSFSRLWRAGVVFFSRKEFCGSGPDWFRFGQAVCGGRLRTESKARDYRNQAFQPT